VDQDYFEGDGDLMLNIIQWRVWPYNPGFSRCYLIEVVDIVSLLKPKQIFFFNFDGQGS
jgi:hypothetical protein